jgi:phosphatidate cytidylyltransferase
MASSFVLAPAAIIVAWLGGAVFIIFWSGAAIVIAWEWTKLVALARNRAAWIVAGGVYAGVTLLAPLILRADPEYGLLAIVLLFAVVWATDIMGFVAGRAIGGRKLWPAISPNKTWSGAIGGLVGALAAGLAVGALTTNALTPIAILSTILSMVAQVGDLLESAIKRKFGAKDTSDLIPGHGGLMDRLDGFIAAAFVAAVIGLVRGGPDAAGHGLLVW